MEKPADTQHPVNELIRRRWSPRAFAPKMVEGTVLASMLEAARWAASSFNEQPWYYLVATKDQPEEFSRMLACLVDVNQSWAKGAPVLMLSFMKTNFSHNDSPNRVAMHDVGAASSTLALEGMTRGVFVHQMGGILLDKIRQTYDIPPGYDPVAAIALGYAGDVKTLPEKFQAAEVAPRQRKPLAQFIYSKMWANPAEFVQDVAKD